MGTYEWQSPADKEKAERKLADAATFLRDASNAIAIRDARIAALESTERELREALKVLAREAHAWRTHTDENYYTNALEAARKTDDNPIAAAAVREAGR